MDVSDWTIDQRMRLPDWCFGNRKLLSLQVNVIAEGSFRWYITTESLPDPACIWAVGFSVSDSDQKYNYIRMGLADNVPMNEAQMDATTPLFPYFGSTVFAPPKIYVPTKSGVAFYIVSRKGLVTGGKKFVAEAWLNVGGTILFGHLYILVSELPTSMAGWLAHNKV